VRIGGDVTDLETADGVTIVRFDNAPVNALDLDLLEVIITSMRSVEGPVVAAVNGHAIAGGCVLAMCADVRLMSGGTIGLTELAVGVPFPVAALEICRYAMGISAGRAALQAKTIDANTALARGWIDAVVPKEDLISEALAVARELGQYSPAAYAATKKQLHRPVRAALSDGLAADADVRASWKSKETRGRINAFLESLARGR
jgi:enoyl-CoA hydratase